MCCYLLAIVNFFLVVVTAEVSKANEKIHKNIILEHRPDFVLEDGLRKKLVRCHSQFGESPFEIGFYVHCIPFRKKVDLYTWLEVGLDTWGDLTRY